jgi:hypothetical protein
MQIQFPVDPFQQVQALGGKRGLALGIKESGPQSPHALAKLGRPGQGCLKLLQLLAREQVQDVQACLFLCV